MLISRVLQAVPVQGGQVTSSFRGGLQTQIHLSFQKPFRTILGPSKQIMVQLCEAVYVSATFQYDVCAKYLYEEVQLMQMVVDKEGSVKEEQFKSVAEIT